MSKKNGKVTINLQKYGKYDEDMALLAWLTDELLGHLYAYVVDVRNTGTYKGLDKDEGQRVLAAEIDVVKHDMLYLASAVGRIDSMGRTLIDSIIPAKNFKIITADRAPNGRRKRDLVSHAR